MPRQDEPAIDVADVEDIISALERVARAIEEATEAARQRDAEPIPTGDTISAAPPPPLETWADLEIMGHRRLIGLVQEDELAGRRMLRVRRLQRAERPPGVGEPRPAVDLEERWRLYSPASVFSFDPLTADEARERFLNLHGTAYPADTGDIPF